MVSLAGLRSKLVLSETCQTYHHTPTRKDARVVELAVLERLCIRKGTEGSNPSPSAKQGAYREISVRFAVQNHCPG